MPTIRRFVCSDLRLLALAPLCAFASACAPVPGPSTTTATAPAPTTHAPPLAPSPSAESPVASAPTASAAGSAGGSAPTAAPAEQPLWAEPAEWVDKSHLPAGIQIFPALYDDPRPRLCGPLQVRQRIDLQHQTLILDLLSPDGAVVKEFKPSNGLGGWTPEWCFDVTGDGNPELMVDEGSGGAHCCHSYHLYELKPAVREILVHAAGNGGLGVWPQDLDGKGAWELVGHNDALVVLGSAPYAFARFLPEVFAWDGHRYSRRTREFKDFLRSERARVEAEGAKECGAGEVECWMTPGEELLGLSLFIGDWPAYSRGSPIPKDALKELEKLRPKLANALR